MFSLPIPIPGNVGTILLVPVGLYGLYPPLHVLAVNVLPLLVKKVIVHPLVSAEITTSSLPVDGMPFPGCQCAFPAASAEVNTLASAPAAPVGPVGPVGPVVASPSEPALLR